MGNMFRLRYRKHPLFWVVLFAVSYAIMTWSLGIYYNGEDLDRTINTFKVGEITYIKNLTIIETFDNGTEDFNEYPEFEPQCSSSFDLERKAQSDINVLEMYENLNFTDKTKYGDWQQKWNISINPLRFKEADKLVVYLLPHAHNDPGWLFTFEEYYKKSVRNILDLMLKELDANPSMKFIWAEMSFFSLWWDEISQDKKILLKKIVERKQLEFVTGGWVMPDEANSHFYSIIIQLFEGNQFLKHHLNYTPRNGWSIDPFGLSPTMAYILKRSGFKNMLIQRTHYLVKQYLGNKQELEFSWRQNWDTSGSTDILTHMEPFSSYTTSATCGPDLRLCKTFDYREPFTPFYMGIETTIQNIDKRSKQLVDQYKKKGMLYKTNKVLVPLGMDFAWGTQREWNDMTRNYNLLSNYVNSKEDLHAQMNYGTLDEYFEAVNSDVQSKGISLSKLSGDFFTYADQNEHYWSGYYTSRPFHKALDRKLVTHLRSAHIAYTFLNAELFTKTGDLLRFPFMNIFFGYLRDARRSLSLFQHHDGVTGTSKDYVMKDYANKLEIAITKCKYVMQEAIKILTHINKPDLTSELENLSILNSTTFLNLKVQPIFARVPVYSLPTLEIVHLNLSSPQALVTVFNPLAQSRISLVSLKINIPEDSGIFVEVTNLFQRVVDSELFPVFENNDKISKNIFYLHFIATLDAVAINNFIVTIKSLSKEEHSEPIPQVFLINEDNTTTVEKHDRFNILEPKTDLPITIANEKLRVDFDSSGLIDTVVLNDTVYKLNVKMFTYGTHGSHGRRSGLYLFLPDGPARLLKTPKIRNIKIVKGRLQSYVEVSLSILKHKIIVYNHAGIESNAIEIRNTIDISTEVDFELVMRFQSEISSGNISYTDLNAFQMIERKRFESMPLQGHYYPMPSASYIEDEKLRMTVLGGQPVGTASLHSGHIDVVMDRKLSRDDGLGVGQGSGQAIKNINVFKLLLETPRCEDDKVEEKAPMLSLRAHFIKNLLLHPVQAFYTVPPESKFNSEDDLQISDYQPTTKIPCDVELLDTIPLANFKDSLDDLSYFPVPEAAVLLHRFGFDARFEIHYNLLKCNLRESRFGQLALDDIFHNLIEKDATQKSLSFVHKLLELQSDRNLILDPMEIYAFHVRFKDSSYQNKVI